MLTLVMIFSAVLFSVGGSEVIEVNFFVPAVITTWKFSNASLRAWDVLFNKGGSAVDAVVEGCSVCEIEQCDFTVGYGGSPDEKGETTLDAMIMDGTTMNVGAVGGLRRIKNAVGVARRVMDNTLHSFLVGSLATKFAVEMGFKEENLTGPYSEEMYRKWRENDCQPNFRVGVKPDPTKYCGPYQPVSSESGKDRSDFRFGKENHDTIGIVAVDSKFRTAAGTSTNGARYKIPGRVGDSPIPGAGAYADGNIGGAVATGDGDIMMRFLPSFLAVEEMKRGKIPEKAAQIAIDRIGAKYPSFRGAVIALRKDGVFGAACWGMEMFPFCVASPVVGTLKIMYAKCKV